MTNTEILRRKMDSSGYKLTFIAKQCGLTYQGFMNKVNNTTDFTAPEIKTLRDLLKMTAEEAETIFFAGNVDETETA